MSPTASEPPVPPEPLDATEAARLVRRRCRRSGLRQYRAIFRSASYWSMAVSTLTVIGGVLHFLEVQQACADILGTAEPVRTRIVTAPPAVVCQAGPGHRAEIPMTTTALVMLGAVFGLAASLAFLLSYRRVGTRIARGDLTP